MTTISDRKTLDDATALMTAFGNYAGSEAASRADRSRDRGNAVHFCHWRQVERLIVALSIERGQGTLH